MSDDLTDGQLIGYFIGTIANENDESYETAKAMLLARMGSFAEGFSAGLKAAAGLLRLIAEAKEAKSHGGLGSMFALQYAEDLLSAADRVEAITIPAAATHGDAL